MSASSEFYSPRETEGTRKIFAKLVAGRQVWLELPLSSKAAEIMKVVLLWEALMAKR